jgi:hypothetical protein
MKRLSWPHFSRAQRLTIHPSKQLVIVTSACVLAGAGLSVGIVHHNQSVQRSESRTATPTKVAPANTTANAATTAPVATATDTATTATPAPINRPGNKYVDETSAGPEKLTYRENQSLNFSPATLTMYTTAGGPVSSAVWSMVYQNVQMSSSDGKPFDFPAPPNAGGVGFGTHTDGTSSAPPAARASWALSADADRAVPGSYTATFTAWSPDRQIRYTGSLQLVVQAAPDGL